MTNSEIEQSGVQTDGNPDDGSSVASDLLRGIFGDEEGAEETPGTPTDTEKTEQPESTQEPEEELPPAVQKALDRIAEKEKALDDRIAGQDKWFTEQNERNKKLREEAGLSNIDKGDKKVQADMKGLGFDPSGNYLGHDYSEELSDETLDYAVKHGRIRADVVPIIQAARPALNVLMNTLRKEVFTTLKAELASVKSEYVPVLERYAADERVAAQVGKWEPILQEFGAKYKPTPAQVKEIQKELKKTSVWGMVDTENPEELTKYLRRVISDPEVIKKNAVEPVKVKKEKEPAETSQDKAKANDGWKIFG